MDLTSLLLWTLSALLVLYLASSLWHYSLFYRLGIPGPMPLPFFGNFGNILRQGVSNFQKSSYRRYRGHKAYGVFDGAQPMIVLRDLEMIKDVCVKNFNSFCNRRPFALQPPADHMLTMIKDDHWKRVRASISPAFSSGKVKRMYPCVAQSTENLLRRLREAAERGEPVELKDVISSYSMDVIAGTGFGVEVNSHGDVKSSVTEAMKEIMNMSGLVVFVTFLCPWIVPICNFLGVRLIRNVLFREFVDAALESRKEEMGKGGSYKRTDFLQLMLEAQEDGNDVINDNMSEDEAKALQTDSVKKPLTHLDYQGQALVFILAGFDTVSNVVAFTLFLLTLNPECLRRAQEELAEVLQGGSLPTYADISKLTYLDMCLNEGMRMYSPGIILDRICNKECVIQGVRIPKGVGVQFPVHAIHCDPDLWPDPQKFDPERFTPENKADRHPYAHTSFGEGPRNCVGMRLAQLEVKVAMAGILRHMTPVTCEKTVYPITLNKMQLKAEDGLWVKMEMRT